MHPGQVAIVGSGPSGFYVAEALLRADPALSVDMLERLPAPFGLVRGGVAPDHPKIKQVTLVYDRIARTPGFRYYGNVTVGRDVTVEELRAAYHAVVFACGAARDLTLGIPGEELPGCYAAGEFVGWYNGHPDFRDREFDLSHKVAIVIGHGNVATDICRMLLTPVQKLAQTDIADYALEALRASRVREVHVIGRRGPAQARFTNAELRELGEIEGCNPIVDACDVELDRVSGEELSGPRGEVNAKNLDIFRSFADRIPTASRSCHFHFFQAPNAIFGKGRVERIVLARTCLEGEPFRQVARTTHETIEVACGLVFRCIGFRGSQIDGVPFDSARGVFPNRGGRITEADASLPGLYAAGWIKRGPVGIIGTNRADGVETAKAILEDLPILRRSERHGTDELRQLLATRCARVVDYNNWLALDAAEVGRGRMVGKLREKFTRVDDMLAVLDDPQR